MTPNSDISQSTVSSTANPIRVTIPRRDEVSITEAMRLCGYRNHRAVQYQIEQGRLAARRIHRFCVMLDRAEVLALASRLSKRAGQIRGPRVPKTK